MKGLFPAGRALAFLALGACALTASPAFAQMSPELQSRARGLLKPCLPDYHKFCSAVEKGNGRILQCLLDHKSELSGACKQGLIRAQTLTTKPDVPQ